MQVQTAQAGKLLLFPIGWGSALDLIPASWNIQRRCRQGRRLLRFRAAPVQPFPYVRFVVAVTQAVQPDKAIRSGRLDRRMLHVSPALDRIAPLLQSFIKGLKRKSTIQRRVNVLPDQPAHGGLPVLLGVPLGVVLGRAFWLNNGQIVFTAEVIGVTSYISIIGFEVIPEHLAVGAEYRVEHDMTMHMGMIGMRGDYGLEAISDKAAGKLHPDSLRLFRGDLAGGKGVDQMIALYGAVYLIPATLGFLHIPIGGIELAVDRADEDSAGRAVHGLFRVHHVAEGVIQTGMDHTDFVIGHSSRAPKLSLPAQRRQRSLLHGCSFARLPSTRSD